MSEAVKVQCPNCWGHGAIRGPQTDMPWFDCRVCEGTGEVTEQAADDYHTNYG